MRSRSLRIVSLLVLLAFTNVYVFANGTTTSLGKNVLLGKLVTNSNRPILVNGGDAITGTIILSGAQLVTPAAVGAIIQLEKVGTVTIAPSSNVTLAFDVKSVAVNVSSGYATVTTVEGVKGAVIGPNGIPMGVPAPSPGSGAGDGFDKGVIAGVAVGGVGLIVALIALNRANNSRDELAALRACLAGQSASPVRLCTSF